jgi:hemolysin III
MTARPARIQTAAELLADKVVHVVGLASGGTAAFVLMALSAFGRGLADLLSAAVYSLGLMAMLGCSAAYNIARLSPRRELLRRFDHAAIFVMIAGTYTPFTILALEGTWAIFMTALVWIIAATGVALKLLLPPRRFEGLSVAIYLAFGWIVVIAAGPFMNALSPTILALVALGGIVYTAGVIFHAWERLPYQNAIWHGFVLTAAAIHFAAVCGVVLAG